MVAPWLNPPRTIRLGSIPPSISAVITWLMRWADLSIPSSSSSVLNPNEYMSNLKTSLRRKKKFEQASVRIFQENLPWWHFNVHVGLDRANGTFSVEDEPRQKWKKVEKEKENAVNIIPHKWVQNTKVDIRVRENPFHMSEIRVDFEHVSNRLPAITSIAQALETLLVERSWGRTNTDVDEYNSCSMFSYGRYSETLNRLDGESSSSHGVERFD